MVKKQSISNRTIIHNILLQPDKKRWFFSSWNLNQHRVFLPVFLIEFEIFVISIAKVSVSLEILMIYLKEESQQVSFLNTQQICNLQATFFFFFFINSYDISWV